MTSSRTRSTKKVLLLSTGGTITAKEMKHNTLHADIFDKPRLLKAIPDLEQIAQIDMLELMRVDSVNMTPSDWVKIGTAINDNINAYDGIVVLHGLDTLPYTASALSFMFRNLPIPIVLTGSTAPLEYVSSDGKRNLIDAIQVAALSDLAEVCVVSDGHIFRGNRIKKVEEVDFCTFQSIIVPPLGLIKGNPILSNGYHKRNPKKKLVFDPRFETDVVALITYPGFNPRILDHILTLNPKGLVLVGYGSGCVPVDGEHSILPQIRKFNQQQGHIVVTTQVTFGQCYMSMHEVGRLALEAGAFSALDMTYETTIVKLMWALGRSSNKEKVLKIMQTNYAGEITPDIMEGGEDRFHQYLSYADYVSENTSSKTED